jgi:hypothetical protein
MESSFSSKVDAETREYFRGVEAHFVALRESPISLSSNDFHRICRWKEQGIPLQVVLRGMDRYFDRIREKPRKRRWFISVSFCENDILDLWEDHLVKQVGSREPGRAAAKERVSAQERLRGVADTLERLAGETEAAGGVRLAAGLRREVKKLRDIAEQSWEPAGMERIDRALALANGRLARKLALLIDDQKNKALSEQAESELESFRERMDGRQFRDLMEKLVNKKVRQHFGLPDLDLLSLL